MAGGCISDLTSRRTYFDECQYWKRDDTDSSLEDYVYEHHYSGIFYAKETTSQTGQKNIVGNMFMFDQNTATIETMDLVNISSGDIIKFQDGLWLVTNVQKSMNNKSKQFLKNNFYKTYIQMKK